MQRQDEVLQRYALLCDRVPDEEALSAMDKMKGVYYRTRTIKSGTLLEVEAYPLMPKGVNTAVRKIEVSKEAIRLHNQRNAEKRLIRLVEANFTAADYYFTGTFEGAKLPTIDEVRKAIKRFVERMNYERKRRGLENARYIYVIEGYSEGSRQQRIHCHMIIDGALDRAELKAIWGKGRVKCDELNPKAYNGLIGLARYLTKDPKGRKRWSSSKGLKQPVITTADRKVRSSTACQIAQSSSEAAAALEKLYPGYEHVETMVRTNPFIAGCYIYAIMRKKEDGTHERGDYGRKGRNGSGAHVRQRGRGEMHVPDGGAAKAQKRKG